jgi:hypothetical protein
MHQIAGASGEIAVKEAANSLSSVAARGSSRSEASRFRQVCQPGNCLPAD